MFSLKSGEKVEAGDDEQEGDERENQEAACSSPTTLITVMSFIIGRIGRDRRCYRSGRRNRRQDGDDRRTPSSSGGGRTSERVSEQTGRPAGRQTEKVSSRVAELRLADRAARSGARRSI